MNCVLCEWVVTSPAMVVSGRVCTMQEERLHSPCAAVLDGSKERWREFLHCLIPIGRQAAMLEQNIYHSIYFCA